MPQDLLALLKRFHILVREDYVRGGGGDEDEIPGTCDLCDSQWHPMDDAEEHKADCLARPTLLEEARDVKV